MAVDTAEKRASAMNMGAGLSWHAVLPPPSGTVTDGDKQHMLHTYSGIAFGPPAGVSFDPTPYIMLLNGSA